MWSQNGHPVVLLFKENRVKHSSVNKLKPLDRALNMGGFYGV